VASVVFLSDEQLNRLHQWMAEEWHVNNDEEMPPWAFARAAIEANEIARKGGNVSFFCD
jgi:hypothetical protein